MTALSRSVPPVSHFESSLLRAKVFDLIKERSFAKGHFKLASGRVSNYYLDLKPTMFHPEGAAGLSEMILDRLHDLKADYVGGLALGAVPLVSTITMASSRHEKPIAGFFVRKDVKDHGTKKLVDGLPAGETLAGKRVVILEDVTTSGDSAMIAVKAAQDSGADVILVLSIVDRQEGAAELYRQSGIPFDALFTARDFLEE
jgi:orotate phosphoribosyltransferase